MSYSIEIKKIKPIEGSNHLIDIFNNELIIYIKHGPTIVSCEMVSDPLNTLDATIINLKKRLKIDVPEDTYLIS